ncbi:MAG: DnaD domain protein [Lachnospiraceae bacterium]|nr:DnaD domain protein [Lachnospiraceae bacterium]
MRIEGLYPTGYTSVPHSFIDRFMVSANGEFVKTYLLLLRLSESGDLSISELADRLRQTEGDVRRALKYWAGQGLLRLTEKGGELESVSVMFPAADEKAAPVSVSEPSPAAAKTPAPAAPPAAEEPPAPASGPAPARTFTAEQLKALKEKQDFDQLLFALEHYLGRTLSNRDVDLMAYLYDTLGFPGEVLEYLAEYCVERWEREDKKKDYRLMRYMETVALNWHSKGAVTLELAKQQASRFAQDSASYAAVAKALGLVGRQLTDNECRMVSSWTTDLKMPQELILEACDRTIRRKNTPDLRYAEGILKSWQAEGIASLAALKEWEAARPKKGKAAAGTAPKGAYQSSLQDIDYAKLLDKKD